MTPPPPKDVSKIEINTDSCLPPPPPPPLPMGEISCRHFCFLTLKSHIWFHPMIKGS